VPPETLVWVDKTNRRAVTAPDDATLGQLSAAIGTQFNIRLAKALRSRVVLFLEGDDMKVLRAVAETLGADRLALNWTSRSCRSVAIRVQARSSRFGG
jgi:hypothetical protein